MSSRDVQSGSPIPQQRDQADPSRRVEDLARAVVAAVAPEEIAFFDDLCAAFFDDPVEALQPPDHTEEPLAGGLSETVNLVTPLVLAALSGVVSDTIKDATGEAIRAGRRRVSRWRRKRRHQAGGEPDPRHAPVPELDAAAVGQVRADIEKLAIRLGIPGDRIGEITITVEAKLARDDTGAGAEPPSLPDGQDAE